MREISCKPICGHCGTVLLNQEVKCPNPHCSAYLANSISSTVSKITECKICGSSMYMFDKERLGLYGMFINFDGVGLDISKVKTEIWNFKLPRMCCSVPDCPSWSMVYTDKDMDRYYPYKILYNNLCFFDLSVKNRWTLGVKESFLCQIMPKMRVNLKNLILGVLRKYGIKAHVQGMPLLNETYETLKSIILWRSYFAIGDKLICKTHRPMKTPKGEFFLHSGTEVRPLLDIPTTI